MNKFQEIPVSKVHAGDFVRFVKFVRFVSFVRFVKFVKFVLSDLLVGCVRSVLSVRALCLTAEQVQGAAV